MWYSDSWQDCGKLEVKVKEAQKVEVKDGKCVDVMDPSSLWVELCCGVNSLQLRLTHEQADALYHQLGAGLQDMQRVTVTSE